MSDVKDFEEVMAKLGSGPAFSEEEIAKQKCNWRVSQLRAYKTAIDTVFGDGYAAKHPELVGAMWQADAMGEVSVSIPDGLSVSVGGVELKEVAQAIESVAEEINWIRRGKLNFELIETEDPERSGVIEHLTARLAGGLEQLADAISGLKGTDE